MNGVKRGCGAERGEAQPSVAAQPINRAQPAASAQPSAVAVRARAERGTPGVPSVPGPSLLTVGPLAVAPLTVADTARLLAGLAVAFGHLSREWS